MRTTRAVQLHHGRPGRRKGRAGGLRPRCSAPSVSPSCRSAFGRGEDYYVLPVDTGALLRRIRVRHFGRRGCVAVDFHFARC